MWVLGCLGNGSSGRHNVEGMRYPNFADMWNFIMRLPLTTLVPFEAICRMEAASDSRPLLQVHRWFNKASHWTGATDGKGSAEADEPGSASSPMTSDHQKGAAPRWLRREIKRLTAAVPTEEEENEEDEEEERSAATGEEEGKHEEDEEENADDDSYAETGKRLVGQLRDPTGNEGHVESPRRSLRTPEKLKRPRVGSSRGPSEKDSDKSPQELPDSDSLSEDDSLEDPVDASL